MAPAYSYRLVPSYSYRLVTKTGFFPHCHSVTIVVVVVFIFISMSGIKYMAFWWLFRCLLSTVTITMTKNRSHSLSLFFLISPVQKNLNVYNWLFMMMMDAFSINVLLLVISYRVKNISTYLMNKKIYKNTTER
jgi:hypothetical protein